MASTQANDGKSTHPLGSDALPLSTLGVVTSPRGPFTPPRFFGAGVVGAGRRSPLAALPHNARAHALGPRVQATLAKFKAQTRSSMPSRVKFTQQLITSHFAPAPRPFGSQGHPGPSPQSTAAPNGDHASGENSPTGMCSPPVGRPTLQQAAESRRKRAREERWAARKAALAWCRREAVRKKLERRAAAAWAALEAFEASMLVNIEREKGSAPEQEQEESSHPNASHPDASHPDASHPDASPSPVVSHPEAIAPEAITPGAIIPEASPVQQEEAISPEDITPGASPILEDEASPGPPEASRPETRSLAKWQKVPYGAWIKGGWLPLIHDCVLSVGNVRLAVQWMQTWDWDGERLLATLSPNTVRGWYEDPRNLVLKADLAELCMPELGEEKVGGGEGGGEGEGTPDDTAQADRLAELCTPEADEASFRSVDWHGSA